MPTASSGKGRPKRFLWYPLAGSAIFAFFVFTIERVAINSLSILIGLLVGIFAGITYAHSLMTRLKDGIVDYSNQDIANRLLFLIIPAFLLLLKWVTHYDEAIRFIFFMGFTVFCLLLTAATIYFEKKLSTKIMIIESRQNWFERLLCIVVVILLFQKM